MKLNGSRTARAATAALTALLLCAAWPAARPARAYTAAGARIFPATGILPQIAPSDAFYLWGSSLPLTGTESRRTDVGGVFDKRITEGLGLHVEDSWSRLDGIGKGPWRGWRNLETELKYRAFDSRRHEFLLTLGLDREWGGTGRPRVGGVPQGATTPRIYFGKGLGDLDIGYLRPLAITGFLGYQVADSAPRPDLVTTGFAVEYSIPYLQSKVRSFDLPGFVRGLTPLTEVLFTVPADRSFGAHSTALVAPGVAYAGEGWELLVEALVPATRATGVGEGFRIQLTMALDFLLPDTIGRPLLRLP